MSAIFLPEDVRSLLQGKTVVYIGDSVIRSMYKDLVLLFQEKRYLTDKELRKKGEECFMGDELLEGGCKGEMLNSIHYREVRKFLFDSETRVLYFFVTACFGQYIEMILTKLKTPDIIIMNSCLWDVHRYGLKEIQGYESNLLKLVKFVKKTHPGVMFVWTTTPPVDLKSKGGFLKRPGTDEVKIFEVGRCNRIAKNVMRDQCMNLVELDTVFHYFTRHRASDGVHWNEKAHRRMSNMILETVARNLNHHIPRVQNKEMNFLDNSREMVSPFHPEQRMSHSFTFSGFDAGRWHGRPADYDSMHDRSFGGNYSYFENEDEIPPRFVTPPQLPGPPGRYGMEPPRMRPPSGPGYRFGSNDSMMFRENRKRKSRDEDSPWDNAPWDNVQKRQRYDPGRRLSDRPNKISPLVNNPSQKQRESPVPGKPGLQGSNAGQDKKTEPKLSKQEFDKKLAEEEKDTSVSVSDKTGDLQEEKVDEKVVLDEKVVSDEKVASDDKSVSGEKVALEEKVASDKKAASYEKVVLDEKVGSDEKPAKDEEFLVIDSTSDVIAEHIVANVFEMDEMPAMRESSSKNGDLKLDFADEKPMDLSNDHTWSIMDSSYCDETPTDKEQRPDTDSSPDVSAAMKDVEMLDEKPKKIEDLKNLVDTNEQKASANAGDIAESSASETFVATPTVSSTETVDAKSSEPSMTTLKILEAIGKVPKINVLERADSNSSDVAAESEASKQHQTSLTKTDDLSTGMSNESMGSTDNSQAVTSDETSHPAERLDDTPASKVMPAPGLEAAKKVSKPSFGFYDVEYSLEDLEASLDQSDDEYLYDGDENDDEALLLDEVEKVVDCVEVKIPAKLSGQVDTAVAVSELEERDLKNEDQSSTNEAIRETNDTGASKSKAETCEKLEISNVVEKLVAPLSSAQSSGIDVSTTNCSQSPSTSHDMRKAVPKETTVTPSTIATGVQPSPVPAKTTIISPGLSTVSGLSSSILLKTDAASTIVSTAKSAPLMPKTTTLTTEAYNVRLASSMPGTSRVSPIVSTSKQAFSVPAKSTGVTEKSVSVPAMSMSVQTETKVTSATSSAKQVTSLLTKSVSLPSILTKVEQPNLGNPKTISSSVSTVKPRLPAATSKSVNLVKTTPSITKCSTVSQIRIPTNVKPATVSSALPRTSTISSSLKTTSVISSTVKTNVSLASTIKTSTATTSSAKTSSTIPSFGKTTSCSTARPIAGHTYSTSTTASRITVRKTASTTIKPNTALTSASVSTVTRTTTASYSSVNTASSIATSPGMSVTALTMMKSLSAKTNLTGGKKLTGFEPKVQKANTNNNFDRSANVSKGDLAGSTIKNERTGLKQPCVLNPPSLDMKSPFFRPKPGSGNAFTSASTGKSISSLSTTVTNSVSSLPKSSPISCTSVSSSSIISSSVVSQSVVGSTVIKSSTVSSVPTASATKTVPVTGHVSKPLSVSKSPLKNSSVKSSAVKGNVTKSSNANISATKDSPVKTAPVKGIAVTGLPTKDPFATSSSVLSSSATPSSLVNNPNVSSLAANNSSSASVTTSISAINFPVTSSSVAPSSTGIAVSSQPPTKKLKPTKKAKTAAPEKKAGVGVAGKSPMKKKSTKVSKDGTPIVKKRKLNTDVEGSKQAEATKAGDKVKKVKKVKKKVITAKTAKDKTSSPKKPVKPTGTVETVVSGVVPSETSATYNAPPPNAPQTIEPMITGGKNASRARQNSFPKQGNLNANNPSNFNANTVAQPPYNFTGFPDQAPQLQQNYLQQAAFQGPPPQAAVYMGQGVQQQQMAVLPQNAFQQYRFPGQGYQVSQFETQTNFGTANLQYQENINFSQAPATFIPQPNNTYNSATQAESNAKKEYAHLGWL